MQKWRKNILSTTWLSWQNYLSNDITLIAIGRWYQTLHSPLTYKKLTSTLVTVVKYYKLQTHGRGPVFQLSNRWCNGFLEFQTPNSVQLSYTDLFCIWNTHWKGQKLQIRNLYSWRFVHIRKKSSGSPRNISLNNYLKTLDAIAYKLILYKAVTMIYFGLLQQRKTNYMIFVLNLIKT